ncbi:MAG TPA: SLBB domain-containing protein [Stellaceae bacterium]|nr:SLBB domain-containing protein [Stellaceae bacterium]
MAARGAVFQGVLALVVPVLLWPATASAQRTTLPPGLIEQLNRTQSTSPYNPAEQLLSPLDQVRQQQQQQTNPQTGLPSLPSNGFDQRDLQRGQERLGPPQPTSQIELDYSRRAGLPLVQYGYDVFRSLVPSRGEIQTGAVADNYRLSIGDELVITLQGQVSRSLRTRIDSEGRIVVPDLPPVPGAGRSFAEVRGDLERAVAAAFLNTSVFVSVGTVRQIAVSILGEANAPGIRRMGGFASALDALAMAGGVKNTGSLRHIMLVRGTTTSIIDLYGVMAGVGTVPDLSLADGDRITIPPIGPTVAIANEVVRPGIYELATDGTISGQLLLALAGGPLRPSGNRFVRLSLDAQGRDMTTEVASLAQLTLRAGDILMVLRRDDLGVGSVRLDGNVRVPGIRSLAAAPDLRRLMGSADAFLPDPYLLLGAVVTTDERTRNRVLVPVDLEAALRGSANRALKDGDTVIVLSVGDVNYLASADVQAVLQGRQPPLLRDRIVTKNPRETERALFAPAATELRVGPPGAAEEQRAGSAEAAQQQAASPRVDVTQNQQAGTLAPGAPTAQDLNLAVAQRDLLAQQSRQICRGLQELATIAATARPGRFANAIYTPTQHDDGIAGDAKMIGNVFPCPPIFDKYPDLLPLLVEHATTIEGEVRIPGPYPVLAGTPLASVVAEAGGLAREVDFKRIEVTHYAVDNARGSSESNRQLVQMTPADLARLALSPGDVVRFNPVFVIRDNGPVSLAGEFRRPGSYEIQRGERLSTLVERAGGLTEQAYPYGAVFTRISVKTQEKEEFTRAARQLESGITAALPRASTGDQSQTLFAATQQLVSELRNTEPVGRVVIEADPTVLQVKPQLDPLLEPGDTVFIPKRPFYVTVAGEVLNPTTLQFRPGASPMDYINQAGGFTQTAEDDRVFIVLPNGQAQPVKTSFWNFTPVEVPPGSTIVVPKNLTPFDLTSFLRDSTQILSQLAISAASLAVIHSNSSR